MKRAIRFLAKMYPAAWRHRYAHEFDALLEEVTPTWPMLFNVLGGAMKMQFKSWSTWKTVAAFGVVGLLAAIGFLVKAPARYVSTAMISMGDGGRERVIAEAERIESRSALTELIHREGLYAGERKRRPLEDVIEQMKRQDIMIRPVNDGTAFTVAFSAPDAGQAQRAAGRLATSFVEANAGTLLSAPSLPVRPQNPEWLGILMIGLAAGIVLGAMVALFNGLKVWKPATRFGILGMLLCGGISYAVPDRFTSTAVLAARGPAANARLRQLVGALRTDADLRQIAEHFNLYPNDPAAISRVRERMRIQEIPNIPAITIQYSDTSQDIAQRAVRNAVWVLTQEDSKAPSSVKLEIVDAASYPYTPYSPNRAMAAGAGLFAGLSLAVGLAVRRKTLT